MTVQITQLYKNNDGTLPALWYDYINDIYFYSSFKAIPQERQQMVKGGAPILSQSIFKIGKHKSGFSSSKT